VPVIINLVIYGSIFVWSNKWLTGIVGGATEETYLRVVLYIVGFLLLLIVCYLLFTIFGGLVTAPFNEKISQHIETTVTGTDADPHLGLITDIYVSVKAEIQKLVFYFGVLLIIFLMNLVPAIGSVISFALGLLFSFYYNALDFLDYPMTRRQIRFGQKLRATNKGRMLTYGFGCMAFLMMFLPVVNVFMKPILVAAGTSLYFEKGYGRI
jgi:CysZ protein